MKKMIAATMLLAGLAIAASPLTLANPSRVADNASTSVYYPAEESLYYYNEIAYNAIGLSQGGLLHWATRFTIDATNAGQLLEAGVYIYINGHGSMPAPGSMNAYSGTTNSPGSPIAAGYTFGPVTTDSWQVYDVSGEGVNVAAGTELWIWVQQQHNAGQFPAAVDHGPCVVNYGCWISIDGVAWSNLSDYGLNYNWNIYVIMDVGDVAEGSGSSALAMTFKTVGCGQTDIHYTIPVSGPTKLTIYDMGGRTITLVNGNVNAGEYVAMVSGLHPGNYIVNLSHGDQTISKNLIIY